MSKEQNLHQGRCAELMLVLGIPFYNADEDNCLLGVCISDAQVENEKQLSGYCRCGTFPMVHV